MEDNISVNRELKELQNERIIQEQTLQAEREKLAFMLKNDMGQDMKDVLSGKKRVKLSKWEIFKYKVNYYINLLFKII